MKSNDLLWLGLIACSLGAGVVGGSYLKKDELLPICHSLAPGLFPPIALALPTEQGVFDSSLQYAGQPWQVTFVGARCDAVCQAHLQQAEQTELPHLVVSYSSDFKDTRAPYLARGNTVQFEQAAESFGLSIEDWSRPDYAATWRLNADHHIERRWVEQTAPAAWAD